MGRKTDREVLRENRWLIVLSPLFAGAFLAAVGTGGLLLLKLSLKTNRKKQAKRDEKLRRKYGENARVGQKGN